MTKLLHLNDPAVQDKVEEVVRDACAALDEMFPGAEMGGITSNFQGLLADVVKHMLLGRSDVGATLSRASLPQLLIDDEFFGNSSMEGDGFMVVKPDQAPEWVDRIPVQVLCPDWKRFGDIAKAGDAWTSFAAASQAALEFCQREMLSLEDAKALKLEVRPVVYDTSREVGYMLADEHKATA